MYINHKTWTWCCFLNLGTKIKLKRAASIVVDKFQDSLNVNLTRHEVVVISLIFEKSWDRDHRRIVTFLMSDLIMFLIMTNFGNQPSRSILEYLINVHLVWTNLWKFCQKSNFSWSCKFVQICPIPHLIHTFPAAEWISEFSKSSFQANHWLNFLLGPSVCVLDIRCWTAFHTF